MGILKKFFPWTEPVVQFYGNFRIVGWNVSVTLSWRSLPSDSRLLWIGCVSLLFNVFHQGVSSESLVSTIGYLDYRFFFDWWSFCMGRTRLCRLSTIRLFFGGRVLEDRAHHA